MTVYLIFLAAVVGVGWYLYGDRITEKQRLWCLVGTGVVLVLLMTLRYAIGYDYFSYKGLFESTATMSIPEIFSTYKVESMFYLLNKLVAMLGGGYHVMLLCCNLIMVGCVIWTIYRHSSIWWLSAALYVTLQFMPHSMNLLRQSIAASIVFASWTFLKEGKFWKYAAVVLLAATFHMSVLVMIPAYFLMRVPFNIKFLGGYLLAIAAGYALFKPLLRLATIVVPKYAVYLNLDIYSQPGSINAAIVPILCLVVVLLFCQDLTTLKPSNGILIYAMLFAATAALFVTKMYIIERFSIYFFMFAMLLLPDLAAIYKPTAAEIKVQEKTKGKTAPSKKVKQKQNEYNGMIALILVISIAYLGYASYTGYHKTYPYVGLWEQEKAVDNNRYFTEHNAKFANVQPQEE